MFHTTNKIKVMTGGYLKKKRPCEVVARISALSGPVRASFRAAFTWPGGRSFKAESACPAWS